LYKLRYYEDRQLTYAWPSPAAKYDPSTQAPLFGHSFLREISLEGRCGWEEDGAASVPPEAQCAALPSTTFEYQAIADDIAAQWPSSSRGGPPNLEATNQVLPYLNSVVPPGRRHT
jgi:hypothetical protein